jgi:hypothetical protein
MALRNAIDILLVAVRAAELIITDRNNFDDLLASITDATAAIKAAIKNAADAIIAAIEQVDLLAQAPGLHQMPDPIISVAGMAAFKNALVFLKMVTLEFLHGRLPRTSIEDSGAATVVPLSSISSVSNATLLSSHLAPLPPDSETFMFYSNCDNFLQEIDSTEGSKQEEFGMYGQNSSFVALAAPATSATSATSATPAARVSEAEVPRIQVFKFANEGEFKGSAPSIYNYVKSSGNYKLSPEIYGIVYENTKATPSPAAVKEFMSVVSIKLQARSVKAAQPAGPAANLMTRPQADLTTRPQPLKGYLIRYIPGSETFEMIYIDPSNYDAATIANYAGE